MTRIAGPGPGWLAGFQARFGEALRTPLDRTSGTLTATPAAYDAALVADVSGAARLAVYNRQYWFRLFGVLQDAYPLTARLVGYWAFNEHAAGYLEAHSPRGWELDAVPDGFATFFASRVHDLAWTESAHLDAAWRSVFRARSVTAFHPTAADASRLLDAHLEPSPTVAIVAEHFPLLDLRRAVLRDPSVVTVAMPPALDRPRSWALVRHDDGITQLPLEPREAELLQLLAIAPVKEALARLEQSCTPEERAGLPERTRAWLARSVGRGFWIGMRAASAAASSR